MPMSREDAGHLLRRAGFGGTVQDIDAWAALDRDSAVERLVTAAPAPSILDQAVAAVVPPALAPLVGRVTSPVNPIVAPFTDGLQLDTLFLGNPLVPENERRVRLQYWWLDRMRTTSTPLVEKLTLFWHNHFPSSQDVIGDSALLHQQNETYRLHALGNYRDLVQAMALEPAMLRYLDNETNRAGSPQENFGRELMELFTLGIGRYTESDVASMAKAWTGFGLTRDRRRYEFHPAEHDTSVKNLFGVSRNFDGPMTIDEILFGAKRIEAAQFIVSKLWSWFAYPDPPPAVVDELTTVFLGSALDVRALMRAMLLHPEFWGPTARLALVRTPAEYVVTTLKALELGAAAARAEVWMPAMGQELFNPPNVASWRQNAYWISTSSYWGRAAFGRFVRSEVVETGRFAEAPDLPAPAAVQAAFDRFGLVEVLPSTRATLEQWVAREQAGPNRAAIPANLALLTMLTPDVNVA